MKLTSNEALRSAQGRIQGLKRQLRAYAAANRAAARNLKWYRDRVETLEKEQGLRVPSTAATPPADWLSGTGLKAGVFEQKPKKRKPAPPFRLGDYAAVQNAALQQAPRGIPIDRAMDALLARLGR